MKKNFRGGRFGRIFEARNGDFYVMHNYKKLQVLKNGETSFKDAPGAIATDGEGSNIFQAQNGDIYLMGRGTRLEVLKNGEKSFKAVPGSTVTDGYNGIIFQAKNGDLYIMGHTTGLEVLKNGEQSFKPAPGSNITNGRGGHILQVKNGDIYAMGYGTGLQVLKNNNLVFTKTAATKKDAQDGKIIISNLHNYYSKLQYKKSDANDWKDVPLNGKIEGLGTGNYQFQWKTKSGANYIGTKTNVEAITGQQIIEVIPAKKQDKDTKKETTKKAESETNTALILGTTIPAGILSIIGAFFLIKYKFFRKSK